MSARKPVAGIPAAQDLSEHTAPSADAFLTTPGLTGYTDADILASVLANGVEAARLRSQPFPVNGWVIVYCRVDEGSPREKYTSGQVMAYNPEIGDGELFVRNIWDEVERVRLHLKTDPEDPDADIVGPAEFFETWPAYELALQTQIDIESKRMRKVKKA